MKLSGLIYFLNLILMENFNKTKYFFYFRIKFYFNSFLMPI